MVTLFVAQGLRAKPHSLLHQAWPLLIGLVMTGLRDIHGMALLAGELVAAVCISSDV